jgi:hypothetical protein
MMYTRITTSQIQPGKLDEFILIFDSLTPQLKDTLANPSVEAILAGPPVIAVYEVAVQWAAQP